MQRQTTILLLSVVILVVVIAVAIIWSNKSNSSSQEVITNEQSQFNLASDPTIYETAASIKSNINPDTNQLEIWLIPLNPPQSLNSITLKANFSSPSLTTTARNANVGPDFTDAGWKPAFARVDAPDQNQVSLELSLLQSAPEEFFLTEDTLLASFPVEYQPDTSIQISLDQANSRLFNKAAQQLSIENASPTVTIGN
jgi:hypothetical protein